MNGSVDLESSHPIEIGVAKGAKHLIAPLHSKNGSRAGGTFTCVFLDESCALDVFRLTHMSCSRFDGGSGLCRAYIFETFGAGIIVANTAFPLSTKKSTTSFATAVLNELRCCFPAIFFVIRTIFIYSDRVKSFDDSVVMTIHSSVELSDLILELANLSINLASFFFNLNDALSGGEFRSFAIQKGILTMFFVGFEDKGLCEIVGNELASPVSVTCIIHAFRIDIA